MEITFFPALLILLASLLITFWYKLAYAPKKQLHAFIAQGARLFSDFPINPNDDFDAVKKGVQANPDLKAVVRKLPGKVFINFIAPELVKEVLTNHNYYDKLNKTYELTKLLTSKSVIMAEGSTWKLHRVLISEAFQYNFFNAMIPTIVQTTDQVIGISSRKEKTVPLPDTTELITADVATKTFFGMESANIETNGRRAADELSRVTMKLISYSMSPLRFFPGMWALNFFKEYRETKQRMVNFRNVFNGLMVKRMQEIEQESAEQGTEKRKRGTDVLEILLQYRHKFNNDPTKTLSDHEILDTFFLFCVAGKDTTSSLVSMALYCYVKNPEYGIKLKEEVESTITTPEAINLDLLNSMSFMSAFLNEALRVYPPAPMLLSRIANQDHYVGDIFVEKGTLVSASIVASNYNPKFFDEPEKFNPTRWLKNDTSSEEGWKANPFSYLPFSGGPRNCIGKHFALIEAKVILSLIIKFYEVSLDPGFVLKIGAVGVAYLPKEPIPFKFVPK